MNPVATTRPQADLGGVTLRRPRVEDAEAVFDLVVRSGRLDVNSRYCYLLWCRDFAATSRVAELGGRVVGFVTGYLKPADPTTYFAWQSAVDNEVPVPGLAFAMMADVLDGARGLGARSCETSVNPGNRAVIMLMRKLALRYDAEITKSVLFDEEELGAGHEVEILYAFSLVGVE
jgi:L-2,4-diaminobutyric acid acetyltransferase